MTDFLYSSYLVAGATLSDIIKNLNVGTLNMIVLCLWVTQQVSSWRWLEACLQTKRFFWAEWTSFFFKGLSQCSVKSPYNPLSKKPSEFKLWVYTCIKYICLHQNAPNNQNHLLFSVLTANVKTYLDFVLLLTEFYCIKPFHNQHN